MGNSPGLEGTSEGPRTHNRKLSHPAIKLKLIRELALSGKTQRKLAEEYSVAESTMTEFKYAHAEAINDVRDNAADEFAGLWAAKKVNRIQVYEDQLEAIATRISENRLGKLAEDEASLLRVAQTALKSIAEEMGQLTARVAVQGEVGARVTHEVVGLDPKDLK